jgi:hypothetical protein
VRNAELAAACELSRHLEIAAKEAWATSLCESSSEI